MLVTLEGIDGSGKTTVWEALHDVYPDATFTREPTGSRCGEAVRRSLADPDADPLAELFLSTADHAAHLADVVRPALEDGDLVVSDRYSDWRYARAAATLDGVVQRPMEYVRGIHGAFTRPPDVTVYLDASPETAAARGDGLAGGADRGYLAAVRANYERLLEAEPERFVRVDAEQSPEVVVASVEDALARTVDGA